MTMSIGLFCFPEMEMLDYAGPYQVFATASRLASGDSYGLFRLVTIGTSLDPVRVRGGAVILPEAAIADHPGLDALIIPGGRAGVDTQIREGVAVEWIRTQAASVPIIASVCTGAFLLAQTGLLDGLQATTHADHVNDLRRTFPSLDVVESLRWVDSGRFITSAGLSAGIDMALHLVERLASRDLSVSTARQLEL